MIWHRGSDGVCVTDLLRLQPARGAVDEQSGGLHWLSSGNVASCSMFSLISC